MLYLCDTAVAPLDLYRTLATEMGVRPSHRRSQLWTDIKNVLVHLVDERGTSPVLILDEAQHLSDLFLIDLSAAGATDSVLADPARELLFRASRGVPRVASTLLRQALREAHDRNQTFIDDHTMEAAIDAAPATQGVIG